LELVIAPLEKRSMTARDARRWLGGLATAEPSVHATAEPSVHATHRDEIAELNRLLYTSERRLGHERGLPDREWYRHQIYAPGYYTGYGVKTLPGIRESVEQEATDRVEPYVAIVSESIYAMLVQFCL